MGRKYIQNFGSKKLFVRLGVQRLIINEWNLMQYAVNGCELD